MMVQEAGVMVQEVATSKHLPLLMPLVVCLFHHC